MRGMPSLLWFARWRAPTVAAGRTRPTPWSLVVLAGVVGLWLAACGGDTSAPADVAEDPEPDAVDGQIDVALDLPGDPDLPDVEPDLPGDPDLAEVEPDVEPDLVEEPDAPLPHRGGSMALTGGGGLRTSTNYTLLVTVGPAMPVGALESTHYRLVLGPQALQR